MNINTISRTPPLMKMTD